MKHTILHYSKRLSGFTLVEILVVSALIALFSGLALFSMSYLSSQSKRKAASADGRTLSDALTVSQMRHGIMPKFCYLSMTQDELSALSTQTDPLPLSFEYFGTQMAFSRAGRILKSWEGPFLPSYAGRTVTGRSGVVKMRMPEQPANTPTSQLYDWPADYWGNPYLLYKVDSPSLPRIICVVSYGANGIPGGGERIFEGLPDGVDPQLVETYGKAYRLFKQEGDHFVALTQQEIETESMPGAGDVKRLLALKKVLYNDGTDHGYMEGTNWFGSVPGILDPGSDDLVVHVH